jgi:hypothetical protein
MKPLANKPRYYISISPNKKKCFNTYEEALEYIRKYRPLGDAKGKFHIYPVDKSGYTSKSDGRKSFGEGNKDWEK